MCEAAARLFAAAAAYFIYIWPRKNSIQTKIISFEIVDLNFMWIKKRHYNKFKSLAYFIIL